ncbi:glycoside hydrolase family 9 protein [Neptunicella marina]|uniref:Endoglucanase n=1 Tax=Neptunicella marina TaxID=2125989 RepID=A0A8J6LYJ2_9ALTE|nr:glycoside hydrolase family 9 protein [Neptunicella marina]MBC3765425.1 glycoside hydrolase family 9 protein [Neptunicella marina]
MRFAQLSLMMSSLLLTACGGTETAPTASNTVKPDSPAVSQTVKFELNQLGFRPYSFKVAVVSSSDATEFSLVSEQNNQVVYTGNLSEAANWDVANQQVQVADFSDFDQQGNFKLVVGNNQSDEFVISDDAYQAVHNAALKAFYFNRASTALSTEFAGDYARAAGHADDKVKIHASAASANRPAGCEISAPKGWYDAGDYNKYIVNSGISTYTLLSAYRQYAAFYQQQLTDIPESANSVPDIIDEANWNLDWMRSMQDPVDGGVYHKLTTLNFAGMVMPKDATAQRYVVQKTVTAALDYAATLALASRIYTDLGEPNSAKAADYIQAAEKAWQWAVEHPQAYYQQPEDVSTGAYGDNNAEDEFFWAAAELYLTTQKDIYWQYVSEHWLNASTPGWGNVGTLGLLSLQSEGKSLLSAADYQNVQQRLTDYANQVVSDAQSSAYQVAMNRTDFVWGSNANALNKAMVLMQLFASNQNSDYKKAAQGLLDYVLGRNPTGYSYVTGFGHKTPMHIHHRPSEADGIAEPVPGWLAGGAQNGQQDDCNYPSNLPALSYVDDVCSYSTNEITINWNAPLVFVLAALNQ